MGGGWASISAEFGIPFWDPFRGILASIDCEVPKNTHPERVYFGGPVWGPICRGLGTVKLSSRLHESIVFTFPLGPIVGTLFEVNFGDQVKRQRRFGASHGSQKGRQDRGLFWDPPKSDPCSQEMVTGGQCGPQPGGPCIYRQASLQDT